jgi:hypothetical protein
MMQPDDPNQMRRNTNPLQSPEGAPPVEESSAKMDNDAGSFGPIDFGPGNFTLAPDVGMVVPLGSYTLIDFIDGVLVKRVPAPYDEGIGLIDVSELASLVHRLKVVSIPLLGGAIENTMYPPGWAQSIDEINLAFECGDDPFSRQPFAEIEMQRALSQHGSSLDHSQYAVKLGRFVESIRSLYEYADFQKSRSIEAPYQRDMDLLDTFLSQAMGRACARSMRSS